MPRPSRKRPRPRWQRIALHVALGLLLTGMVAFVVGVIVLWKVTRSAAMPDLSRIESYQPKVTTRIFSADGQLLGELAQERRTVVPFEKIPRVLVQAVVDAEDAAFYEHSGISYWGMLRALLANLRQGRVVQGGSTITQQMVKTLLLTPERTFTRKIQELYLAHRLENNFTKDQILWLYLNQINYGHGRYGCQEAARFYFGKEVDQIDIGEAALLAGLPQSPTRLEPIRHPKEAKRRQTYVLAQMAKHGHIKPEEAEHFTKEPIQVVKSAELRNGLAPEVTDLVKQLLVEKVGAEEKIWTLGLDVRTSIDSQMQILARQSVERGLEALDARESYRGPTRHLKGTALEKHAEELKRQLAGGPPKPNTIYEGIVRGVDDETTTLQIDLGGVPGVLPLGDDTRYNPQKKPPSKRFREGDLVRVRPTGEKRETVWLLQPEFGPQAAMVVIEPSTRHIKAMVGGYRYQPGTFNRATRARRQPGSSFKPLLYVTAFDQRKYTPASLVNDAPEVYDLWKPQNDEKEQFRGAIRLREALAHSVNTVAIRIMSDVGPPAVIDMARRFGIKSELQADLSLALGSSGVTVLEMANAYATFAAQGQYRDAQLVVTIGNEPVPFPAATEAVKPDVAFLMTQVMTSVVQEGTAARAAAELKRPAAGKTGTTNAHRDAWFIGFTPDLVAAVWVGFDDVKQLGKGEQGARAALPIWTSFMSTALKSRPPTPFAQPPGVVVERIDPKTGLLAPAGAQAAIDEYFLEGTAPTQTATQEDNSNEQFLLEQGSN